MGRGCRFGLIGGVVGFIGLPLFALSAYDPRQGDSGAIAIGMALPFFAVFGAVAGLIGFAVLGYILDLHKTEPYNAGLCCILWSIFLWVMIVLFGISIGGNESIAVCLVLFFLFSAPYLFAGLNLIQKHRE